MQLPSTTLIYGRNPAILIHMDALVRHLCSYAAYHRDARNVRTHMVGIPLIVLAVVILLSRPVADAGAIALTPAMLVSALTTIYYLRLDLRFGLAMGLVLAVCTVIGLQLAALPTGTWLGWGMGLFVFGWTLQFVGHHYEGRKPAFFDDIRGLIIGPLFIMAEVAFALGLRLDVRSALAARR